MNRNAARHLALVVSILLCFFVYMGYRYWGRTDSQPEEGDVAAPSDIAYAPGLRPGNDLVAPGSFSLTPPPGGGDGSPLNGGAPSDVSYPIGSIDEQLSSSPSGLPPPPSGSIEESGTGPGEITGLIPAAPLTPPGGGSATSPGTGGGSALLPPPPGGGLKPPGSESAGTETAVAPSSPPPPVPASGTGVAPIGARAGAGSVTPPASSPVRPPAAAEAGESRGTALPAQPPSRASGVSPPAPARPGSVSPVVPPAARPSVPTGPAATPNGNMPVSDSLRIYVVQPGDTLSRIAARELGSIALADNIFLLNRDVISDPDHLMAGVRIRLPIRETLAGVAGAGSRPQAEQRVVHRVQRGDTLSSIAARYYGSSAAWQFLHQANVSVVPNPDQLSVGMELIIPPYEEMR